MKIGREEVKKGRSDVVRKVRREEGGREEVKTKKESLLYKYSNII